MPRMAHLYPYKTRFLLTAITHRLFRGRYQHSAAQVEKPLPALAFLGLGSLWEQEAGVEVEPIALPLKRAAGHCVLLSSVSV